MNELLRLLQNNPEFELKLAYETAGAVQLLVCQNANGPGWVGTSFDQLKSVDADAAIRYFIVPAVETLLRAAQT